VVNSASVSISSGSPNLTVTGASFAASDVGKPITITGAGAAGASLLTTILQVNNATSISLTSNAGSTLSATASVVRYGTDNTTKFQAANDYLENGIGAGYIVCPNGS